MKRAITKVIFSKLHIDAEDVAGHDLTDGIKGLVETGASAGRPALTSTDDESGSTLDEDGAAFDLATDAVLLGVVLADHGSSRTAMVEVLAAHSHIAARFYDLGTIRHCAPRCPASPAARVHHGRVAARVSGRR